MQGVINSKSLHGVEEGLEVVVATAEVSILVTVAGVAVALSELKGEVGALVLCEVGEAVVVVKMATVSINLT